ncbi:MAG TPA: SUMF1/EgtB/PvdO family nonheme iron enzyme, partial [Chthoniobacteraceae bacterium]
LRYGEYDIVGARQNTPRLLGEGGFGKTYEAVRIEAVGGAAIREHVAIKVLNPDLLTSEAKRRQFLAELHALTTFQHPNLIRYISCGEQNGELYYAMELCRGGDLLGMVRRFGPLPERAAAQIILQVANGLREVHQRHGLVHRDIKPSNIMLAEELAPDLKDDHLELLFEQHESLCRLVDFGLVDFALKAEKSSKRFVGTPMYASPEQVRGRQADARSDIYCLGMTLLFLVQGKGPLLDEAGRELRSLEEVMLRNGSSEEHRLPLHVSRAFCEVVARMIAKNPEKRIPNAAKLQAALRDYLRFPGDPDEVRFPLTRHAQALDTLFDFGPRLSTRGGRPIYHAREKFGGRRVKLCVAAQVNNSKQPIDVLARDLCKFAQLSYEPNLPSTLAAVHAVIWADDFLAYSEDLQPSAALTDLLKARSEAGRQITFAEAVVLFQPIAQALDYLQRRGRQGVALSPEEIGLAGPTGAFHVVQPNVLLLPLTEWNGLRVCFGLMPAHSLADGGASAFGSTVSGSMHAAAADSTPIGAFARLIYRVIAGVEAPLAVQYAAHAYDSIVGLSPTANEILRDALSRRWIKSNATELLRQLCAAEGVALRAPSPAAIARVVAPGVVRTPYAPADSTQRLTFELWEPGWEFLCDYSRRRVSLPEKLPRWEESSSEVDPSGTNGAPGGALPDDPSAGFDESLQKTVVAPRGSVSGSRQKSATSESRTHDSSPAPSESLPLPGTKYPHLGWWIAILVVILVSLCMLAWALLRPGFSRNSTSVEPIFAGNQAGESRSIAGSNFRWCPPTGAAGFKMGSPPEEVGRQKNETQHDVVLSSGFWMSENLVTQAQWLSVMKLSFVGQVEKALDDDTLINFPPLGDKPASIATLRDHLGLKKGETEKMMGLEDRRAPIYWVNWEEATEYCRFLNEHEHAAGRLPKDWEICLPWESQWEYACRAGTTTATYAGEMAVLGKNNAAVLDAICWYGGNCGIDYVGRGFKTDWLEKAHEFESGGPRFVGEKVANPWGLHDTLGNLSEWCQDWYTPQYPNGTVRDPGGPVDGKSRVMRGNSWNGVASFCRAAARGWQKPYTRSNALGFRPAVVRISAKGIPAVTEPEKEAAAVEAPKEPPKDLGVSGTVSAGKTAGDSITIENLVFHWCPPTGPEGFVMGSPANEAGRSDNEQQHTAVLTRGFWMAETLVTQGAWNKIMQTSLAQQAAKALADNSLYDLGGKKQTLRDYYAIRASDSSSAIGVEEADFPMYWVNWNEAVDFCKRVTERERATGRIPIGWEARLPSEAQWEYACRAGTTT